MTLPELPENIGDRSTIEDIGGNPVTYVVEDEIKIIQSTQPEKAIYLQKLRFEPDGRSELRLGYYMIGKKPSVAGRWVWGQFATMIPVEDFIKIYRLAEEKGWFD